MGQPIPEWVYEKPYVPPFRAWYLRAFWDLDSERNVGWDLGRIPWSKADEYAERMGIEDHMRQPFHDIIRCLDDAYLTWQRDQRKKKGKK